MKVLDLINKDTSEIKYEVSSFPDGQQQVKINMGSIDNNYERGKYMTPVVIKARLNNFRDLELIVCAVASLRTFWTNEIHLYTPYFLGSRSDRRLEEGSNNYLKHVICPIINSLHFETVTVVDPHSDVLEACLNNFRKIDNLELIKWSTREIFGVISEKGPNSQYPCVLISPDAGANKKIFKIADQIGYTGDIITCSKSRDENGKLSRVEVPIKSEASSTNYIIIDDICDGGATFINIAKAIKEKQLSSPYKSKIYLIATHGIFSKGFTELNEYFDGIYCTNSYFDMKDPDFLFKYEKKISKLYQFNIF